MFSLVQVNKLSNPFTLKTPYQIEQIEALTYIAWSIMEEMGSKLIPGITGLELEAIFQKLCSSRKVIPALQGFEGFDHFLCINSHGIIGHGKPNGRVFLKGDLLTLDFVIEKNDWHVDIAWTFCIGEIHPIQGLAFHYQKAFSHGIILKLPDKYEIFKPFAGHGIGREIHEQPAIPHFSAISKNTKKHGLVFTLEPLILKSEALTEYNLLESKEWQVNTAVHAQFENMYVYDISGVRNLAKNCESYLRLCASIGQKP